MITLKVEKRNPEVKAKKLRRDGFVCGVLYGKEMKESTPIQLTEPEALRFIKANKEGTQVMLDLDGKQVDALVKNIDYDPMKKQIMALDFQLWSPVRPSPPLFRSFWKMRMPLRVS